MAQYTLKSKHKLGLFHKRRHRLGVSSAITAPAAPFSHSDGMSQWPRNSQVFFNFHCRSAQPGMAQAAMVGTVTALMAKGPSQYVSTVIPSKNSNEIVARQQSRIPATGGFGDHHSVEKCGWNGPEHSNTVIPSCDRIVDPNRLPQAKPYE